jgi:hypothetical protein
LVGVGRAPTAQSILLQENVTAATSEAPMRMTGSVKSRIGCEVCPAETGQHADSPAPSRRARRFGRRGSARTVLAAQLSADGERCVLLTSRGRKRGVPYLGEHAVIPKRFMLWISGVRSKPSETPVPFQPPITPFVSWRDSRCLRPHRTIRHNQPLLCEFSLEFSCKPMARRV